MSYCRLLPQFPQLRALQSSSAGQGQLSKGLGDSMGNLLLGPASPCSPRAEGRMLPVPRSPPHVSAGGSSGPGAVEVTDGDVPGARPLSAPWRRRAAIRTRRWRLPTGPGPQPVARRSAGPRGSGPFVGVSPPAAGAPSRLPPTSLSTFNLTCSFHMEMGCKWVWGWGGGAARGQRLRPASGSLHPNLRDHTHSLGAAGGPWGEGVPLVPQQWSSSLPLPRKTIPAARS